MAKEMLKTLVLAVRILTIKLYGVKNESRSVSICSSKRHKTEYE